MECSPVQNAFLFILLALLVGQGHGRWKRSNREMLQHDVKLFKEMTEKIKEELGAYYDEYSDEPFADYFLEEIDYLQSKIEKGMRRKTRTEGSGGISYSNTNGNQNLQTYPKILNKVSVPSVKVSVKNVTIQTTDKNVEWPSFEDMLTAMGKKYDWKNDRWIKVKNKIKHKNKRKPDTTTDHIEHQKHNFRYRIVKLNRAKSKRNIVVAVTAVR